MSVYTRANPFVVFYLLFSFSSEATEKKAFRKIANGLRQEVELLRSNPNYDYEIPVIVQVEEDLSESFMEDEASHLQSISSIASKLTARKIAEIVESNGVKHVSVDAQIAVSFKQVSNSKPGSSADHLHKTLGLHEARANALNGEDIAVAVFDSGISKHSDIGDGRVIAAVDFTGDQPAISRRNTDGYGHGTHVAGIIGSRPLKNEYLVGVAPKVNFVDLKVLNSEGLGRTSRLIQAIDWLIANNTSLGVRVANFSVSHPPLESYTTDPLCKAVRRLVQNGITVVASSGNLGSDDAYPLLWGGITSPGTDPSVITVYPTNTQGTSSHTDDTSTSFGSRGPSYPDMLFKPDLAAPGVAIPSVLAPGSLIDELAPNEFRSPGYVELSGSSMAAPFVSGTVALMLQANPKLTPAQVKLILLASAVKLANLDLLEQGNGFLNIVSAVDIAFKIDVERQRINGRPRVRWKNDLEIVSSGGSFLFGSVLFRHSPFESLPLWGNGSDWFPEGESLTDLLNPSSVFWIDRLGGDSVFWVDRLHSDSVFWVDRLRSDSVFWVDRVTPSSVFWIDRLRGNSVFWIDRVHSDSVFWVDRLRSGSVFWIDRIHSNNNLWIE